MIAQPPETDMQTPMIYVGFCWNDLTQDVDFRFSSLRCADTVAAMSVCLTATSVAEDGYKAFLLDQLGAWTGEGTLVTTLAHHRIVMFAVQLAR